MIILNFTCVSHRYYGTGPSKQPVLITVTQFGDCCEQKQSNADLDTDPNKYCLQRSTTDSRISYTPNGRAHNCSEIIILIIFTNR